MINQQPKKPKPKFTELLISSAYLQRAIKRNRRALDRFFSNNAYLLSQKKITVYRQLKDISEASGFTISQSVYYCLRVGRQDVCSTAIVYVIGEYWGIDGDEMLNKDITKGEQLVKEG